MKIKAEILAKINELLSILDSQDATLKQLTDKLAKIDKDIQDLDAEKSVLQEKVNNENLAEERPPSDIIPLINTAEQENSEVKED